MCGLPSSLTPLIVLVQPQISWCQVDYEITWQTGARCTVAKLSTVLERQSAAEQSVDAPSGHRRYKLPPAPPICLVAINLKSVTAAAHSSHSEVTHC